MFALYRMSLNNHLTRFLNLIWVISYHKLPYFSTYQLYSLGLLVNYLLYEYVNTVYLMLTYDIFFFDSHFSYVFV